MSPVCCLYPTPTSMTPELDTVTISDTICPQLKTNQAKITHFRVQTPRKMPKLYKNFLQFHKYSPICTQMSEIATCLSVQPNITKILALVCGSRFRTGTGGIASRWFVYKIFPAMKYSGNILYKSERRKVHIVGSNYTTVPVFIWTFD